MRRRSLSFLGVGLLAWVAVWRLTESLMRTGFAYELGSVAYPVPMYLRLMDAFALAASLSGLCLLAFDFVRWVRTKRP
jgi:hypothetical protein